MKFARLFMGKGRDKLTIDFFGKNIQFSGENVKFLFCFADDYFIETPNILPKNLFFNFLFSHFIFALKTKCYKLAMLQKLAFFVNFPKKVLTFFIKSTLTF